MFEVLVIICEADESMENKPKINGMLCIYLSVIAVVTLVVSMLPEIIFQESTGSRPAILPYIKLLVLLIAAIVFLILNKLEITKYILVLKVMILADIITGWIYYTSFWQETFDPASFFGNIDGSIILKIIGIIPVLGILLLLYGSPKEVYLTIGDLSVKAEEIKVLGIKKDKIAWGKLAIISAVLITLGTILISAFTVRWATVNFNFSNLAKYFPLALVFAVFNSLCEGILMRMAILGPLRNILPKNYAIFISSMIFGIGHFYGAPSGIVGVIMSFILGLYMTRSMYETKGFVSSWIIHFMQDLVIFSTMLVMGNFT